jgi:hypothetical protein
MPAAPPPPPGETEASWYNDETKLRLALPIVDAAYQIGSEPPRRRRLIQEIIA